MKKKLFSIIMCVLMVMCFMPSMAFADEADYVEVVNGNSKLINLHDGYCLTSNDATEETAYTDGTGYVARYSDGTLYLNGYAGVNVGSLTSSYSELYGIYHKYLKIVVEADSTLSVTNNGTDGNAYGLYCGTLDLSGAGKLNINVTNKVGSANGINACFAYETSKTKISSPVDITVVGKSGASGAAVSGIASYTETTDLTASSGKITVTSVNGTSEYDANGVFCYDGNLALGNGLEIVAKAGETDSAVTCQNVYLNKDTIKVTSGTFNFDPTSYVDGNSYIVKRSGSEGAYVYTVLAKANLTSGTYLTDPAGSLAGYYYSYQNEDGTYTVYYSAPSKSTTTDNVTNTTETTKTDGATTTVPETKATVKAETKTAADGTKTTTSTVDTTTAAKIVEKAVANKSEEVIVNAGTTAVAETAAGTTTEVAIPAETVSQIAEKTTAAVKIETEAAEVMLDEQAVEAVAEQAGETGNVKLVVETKAQDENKVEVELKLETDKGAVSDFKGGTVSVTVKLNSALAAKPVMCVYIDDNGVYHKVAGHKNADGTYTFTTGHFSTYAIMSEDEANDVIADQAASAKDDVKALSLKARSSKTSKGSIKVNLTVSGDEIQDIEKLGYTVKYKFYRSTKKSSGYTAMKEKDSKTYTNTTGKKGTRYYYKARVMVYDSEGTLIAKSALKQCKYACRTK